MTIQRCSSIISYCFLIYYCLYSYFFLDLWYNVLWQPSHALDLCVCLAEICSLRISHSILLSRSNLSAFLGKFSEIYVIYISQLAGRASVVWYWFISGWSQVCLLFMHWTHIAEKGLGHEGMSTGHTRIDTNKILKELNFIIIEQALHWNIKYTEEKTQFTSCARDPHEPIQHWNAELHNSSQIISN